MAFFPLGTCAYKRLDDRRQEAVSWGGCWNELRAAAAYTSATNWWGHGDGWTWSGWWDSGPHEAWQGDRQPAGSEGAAAHVEAARPAAAHKPVGSGTVLVEPTRVEVVTAASPAAVTPAGSMQRSGPGTPPPNPPPAQQPPGRPAAGKNRRKFRRQVCRTESSTGSA